MGMGRIHRMPSEEGIGRKTISMLLRPRTWSPAADGSFVLDSNEVIWLCDQVQELLEAESTLLQLSAPVKVFGDIHGQYTDLSALPLHVLRARPALVRLVSPASLWARCLSRGAAACRVAPDGVTGAWVARGARGVRGQ